MTTVLPAMTVGGPAVLIEAILVMAGFILVREGSLVIRTGAEALPTTLPQIVFAVLMLGIGIAAGRASRGGMDQGAYDANYQHGEGI